MGFTTDPAVNQFLFGLTTGIAVAATASFLYSTFSLLQAAPARTLASPLRAAAKPAEPAEPASDSTQARLEAAFTVSKAQLHDITRHFMTEMARGLASHSSTLKMIPSYVVNLPSGTETGTVLALDLGGSNFRVCEVTLEGSGRSRMRQKKYTVSDDLKTGSGDKLFDFFAACVAEFVGSASGDVKLGFTFSFPCLQTGLAKGTLINWTKGFTASGVEGKDPVKLLQTALARKGVKVRVTALVNDTVGCLVSHAYSDPNTHVGVILGTGTNAAYVERVDRIPKWDGPIPDSEVMVVNMEWGAFGEGGVGLPLAEADAALDRGSAYPKRQVYEKMISGMYLGEIMRIVVQDLVKTGELFGGVGGTALDVPYSFETALLSRIERDHSEDLSDVRTVLHDLCSVPTTSLQDRRLIKRIAELIGTRSARLAAAGIAAIVTRINRLDDCTVAIDGSLFEHYPHYANRMRDALREIVGMAADNIVLVQARDGSGQGAALIAALAE
ncbi:hypothetical protein BC831DRAFT_500082 [Entophlyctis helioformis]|nr:hypothetical protein BC831DRAFT_500082 [Entophlyctis helioformis]